MSNQRKNRVLKISFLQNTVGLIFLHFVAGSLFLMFKNVDIYIRLILYFSFQLFLLAQYKNVTFNTSEVVIQFVIPFRKVQKLKLNLIKKVDVVQISGQLASGFILILFLEKKKIKIDISSSNFDLLQEVLQFLSQKNIKLSKRAKDLGAIL